MAEDSLPSTSANSGHKIFIPSSPDVFDLYKPNKFSGELLNQYAVRPVTAIHRKRRVQVPKKTGELMLIAWSTRVGANTFNGEPTNGVILKRPIQKYAMVKLQDMTLRTTINDLGMDLSCLLSDSVKSSSRELVTCWRRLMESYHDNNRADLNWNVVEGADSSESTSFDNSSCVLLTIKELNVGDELSVCYGVYFWLLEIRRLITSRNIYGYWLMLVSHLLYDKTLKQWPSQYQAAQSIAESCADFILEVYKRSDLGDELVFSLASMDEYDLLMNGELLEPIKELLAELI